MLLNKGFNGIGIGYVERVDIGEKGFYSAWIGSHYALHLVAELAVGSGD